MFKNSKKVSKAVKPQEKVRVVVHQGGEYLLARVLLILVLVLINAGIWAYFCYRVRVMCDEVEYAERAKQQTFMERLRRPKKKVVLDAVAVVDGEAIELADIKEMISDMPQLEELSFEEIYPNLLEMLVNNRVVMRGAQKAGVLDRPEIKKQLRLAKEQIVGQTYLDELLKAHTTEK